MSTVTRRLLIASNNGSINDINLAISEGADINHIDDDGLTALIAATYNSHASTVEHLLNLGANPNLGLDPPLCFAALKGFVDVAKILVSSSQIDLNARNRDNFTALHDASEQGNIGIVQILLDYGANVNVHGNWNVTPIHFASQNGHTDVVKILLKAGARIDVVTEQGETPKHIAERKGHRDIVKKLVEHERITPILNASIEPIQIHQAEHTNQDVMVVEWDDDCIKFVYQQRCDCGRFWTMKNYKRNRPIDIIECQCPECNLVKEFAFKPTYIHTSINELIKINKQYARM